MATINSNLSVYDESSIPSAESLRFGIIVSEWNPAITHALFEACKATLLKHGAKEENIHVLQVPGSFELPMGARLCIASQKVDAVVCIGCVIKGETSHNDYINRAVASGLTSLSMMSNIPCIFGVLTPNNMEQAEARAGGIHGNKGVEAATTAIRMAAMKKELTVADKRIGFGARN